MMGVCHALHALVNKLGHVKAAGTDHVVDGMACLKCVELGVQHMLDSHGPAKHFVAFFA